MASFERVSLWALIYFIGRTLVLFARHALNLLPLLVVIVTGGEQLRTTLLWAIAVGLPVLIVAHAAASWWFFRYCATEDTLHLREGIFKRRQLTLEYERIQQADIRQPWYFRPFSQAVLGVESAGSQGREVELAGLTHTHAESLKQAMMQHRRVPHADRETFNGETSASSTANLEMVLPARELARFGLIHNPVLLVFPVAGYLLSQFDLVDEWLLPRLEGLSYATLNGGSVLQNVSLWSAALMLILAIVIGLSVLIAIIRYHGFTLTVAGQRYQTRAGLLTIVSRSFQYIRLQRLVWSQGLVARLLKRKSLRIDQSGRPDTMKQAKTFFIPVLDHDRESQLWQTLRLSEPVWQSFHPMSMALPWFIFTSMTAIIAGLATSGDVFWTLLTVAVGASLIALLVWGRWRRRAYFVNDDWLALRYGLFGQQQRWIPACKMQTLRVRQGPWLRLWGMSALLVYSAAGRERIAWLPCRQVEALQDHLMSITANFQGRWM
ncbi:PH domain-containing protein [Pseudohongiella acticola]|jgi:putative membrane protein